MMHMDDSVGLLNMYKTSKTRHLYCIDWNKFSEVMEIWGTENDELSY